MRLGKRGGIQARPSFRLASPTSLVLRANSVRKLLDAASVLRTDAARSRTAMALCLPPFPLNATALYPEVTTAEEGVVHPRAMAT